MPEILDPERRLALAYAPIAARAALATLFALDEKFASIVARTTEPTIGLMRLVWWRDALAALDRGAPPAEPLLMEASILAAQGIDGEALAAMTTGWEALLDDPELDPVTVGLHGAERGGRLFRLAAKVLGNDRLDGIDAAGEGWARVDLAHHASDPAVSDRILGSAAAPLSLMPSRWPRPLRPLGQLAVMARHDAKRGASCLSASASRARLLRILAFHTAGR